MNTSENVEKIKTKTCFRNKERDKNYVKERYKH